MKILVTLFGLSVLAGATYSARTIVGEMPRLIDAGGGTILRLHVDGKRSPTVILEMPVSPRARLEISSFARVIDYDRGGSGNSFTATPTRNASQIARELHAVLAKASIPPPYVLVGDTFSSLFVRAYAGLYPGEVQGLLLIDPIVEEDQANGTIDWLRIHNPESYKVFAERLDKAGPQAADLVDWLAYQRVFERRKMDLLLMEAPPEQRQEWADYLEQQLHVLESERETYTYIINIHGYEWNELVGYRESFAEMRALPPQPALPVSILTHLRGTRQNSPAGNACVNAERQWMFRLQDGLLKKYPKARHLGIQTSDNVARLEDQSLFLQQLRELCHPPSAGH